MSSSKSAAFFRLEGTLTSRSTLMAAAWMASHAPTFSDRLARLGSVAMAAPFAWAMRDATTATRLTWSGLRGLTEDRIILLGEEHFELFYRDALQDLGHEFLRKAQSDGIEVVLISDSIDVLVQPVADLLGIRHVVANRLEMRDGLATGRLIAPISTGRLSGQQVREMATDRDWDLHRSTGYGSQETDSTLLSALGNPCTVHPDRALRRIAQDLDWPIVER